MADHDRHAGSRGEEEAPRDPTPARGTHHQPTFLRYGEHTAPTYTVPTGTLPDPLPADAVDRPSGLRDWLSRRRTQVAGAGALGLVIGALLGGTAVSALIDLPQPPDGVVVDEQGSVLPPEMRGECHQDNGTLYCILPPADTGPVWTG